MTFWAFAAFALAIYAACAALTHVWALAQAGARPDRLNCAAMALFWPLVVLAVVVGPCVMLVIMALAPGKAVDCRKGFG